jgi:hypothetical protein
MNKETKKLYNWLLSKPGYIKNSIEKILEKYPHTAKLGKMAIWDGLEALKQAKLTRKKEVEPNKKLRIAVKEYTSVIEKPKMNNRRNIPGTYLTMGCTHCPWHNKQMFQALYRYLKKEKIELQGLILGGDIMDLNSLSSHDKGKIAIQGVTLDWEYKETNKFLDELDLLKFTKTATKDYVWGNHESRYQRVMQANDESKYGAALQSPEDGLNLKKRGYNVYTDWKNDVISLGPNLDIGHGEFLSTHSAKKTIDTYRKSMMYWHTHRFQIYIEGMVGGFNMGFGGDINAPIFGFATRAMKNSWVNSLTLVHLDEEGFYYIQPMMFINDKFIINGRKY